MQFNNIYSLFRSQCAKYAHAPVFYTRRENGWNSQTWKEFEQKTLDLACAFLSGRLTKGASVAILAGNIPEWTICDIAVIAAGGVGVGIYPTSSAEQCRYIVEHSDAEFVIVDTAEQLRKVAGIKGNILGIFCIEDGSFAEFLAHGSSVREHYLPEVEAIGASVSPDDIAIMVYTSGTTGQPKGAMLSHRYVLNSVESLRRSVPIFDTDVSLSYLPGCHVAERISGIYNRLYNGTPAYFVNDLSKLYRIMLDVKPTVFASLPRFFEKIHAAIVGKNGEDASAETLREAFGGKVRLLTSGGAPLPTEIAEFYRSRGLPILQAYGLTENICGAFNTVEANKFGTVGRPMPMSEIKIAADGEILIKSEMMFSGYYKDPEKTAEMFDADGWLKSGDLGELDADGFLKITGRKKEIIVLSNGKNVSPALVENLVKESHIISHCFVYGDSRSYCVGLITLNTAEICSMTKDEIEERVADAVTKANERISSSEQIKRYVVLDSDFLASSDEITPTMKVKRDVVARNYRQILEDLYEQK